MPRLSFALVIAALAAVIVPSAATSAAIRTCAAADLTARMYPTGGSGAGTLEIGVRLRNVSGTRCAMKGYPGLGLRRSNETAMRGFAVFDKTKTPKRIVLANGGYVHAIIRYGDVPSPGDPGGLPEELLPAGDAAEPPRVGRGARPPGAVPEGPDAGLPDAQGQVPDAVEGRRLACRLADRRPLRLVPRARRPSGPPCVAAGRHRRRRRDRRRRLHRAVDGVLPEEGRPGAADHVSWSARSPATGRRAATAAGSSGEIAFEGDRRTWLAVYDTVDEGRAGLRRRGHRVRLPEGRVARRWRRTRCSSTGCTAISRTAPPSATPRTTPGAGGDELRDRIGSATRWSAVRTLDSRA